MRPQILQESLAYPRGEILPESKLNGTEAIAPARLHSSLPVTNHTSTLRLRRKAGGGRRKGLGVQLSDEDDKQAVMDLVTPRVDEPLECDRRMGDFRKAE